MFPWGDEKMSFVETKPVSLRFERAAAAQRKNGLHVFHADRSKAALAAASGDSGIRRFSSNRKALIFLTFLKN